MRLNGVDTSRGPVAIRGVFIAMTIVAIGFAFVVGKLAAASVRYFPLSYSAPSLVCDKSTVPREIVSDIEADWYSGQWRAAEEPSLYLASQAPSAARAITYRFTWLRSFHHPVIVRVDAVEGGRMRLTAKQLSGAGGYDPGGIEKQVVRTLTPDEQAKLQAALTATQVLSLPAIDCHWGADGSQWIVEANAHGRYSFVNRWTPDDGPVRTFGLLLLSFTGWRFDRLY